MSRINPATGERYDDPGERCDACLRSLAWSDGKTEILSVQVRAYEMRPIGGAPSTSSGRPARERVEIPTGKPGQARVCKSCAAMLG